MSPSRRRATARCVAWHLAPPPPPPRALTAPSPRPHRALTAPSPRLTRAAAPHRPWRLATAVRGLASRTTTAHPSPLPAPLHTPWRARSLPGRRDRDIAPYRHYTRVIRPPPRPLPRLTLATAPPCSTRRALAAPRHRAASPVAARHRDAWPLGLRLPPHPPRFDCGAPSMAPLPAHPPPLPRVLPPPA